MCKSTIEEAIERERLRDELHAIAWANLGRLPGETYEENLLRRAKLEVRKSEILSEMGW
jgi:hypothetical protein